MWNIIVSIVVGTFGLVVGGVGLTLEDHLLNPDVSQRTLYTAKGVMIIMAVIALYAAAVNIKRPNSSDN